MADPKARHRGAACDACRVLRARARWLWLPDVGERSDQSVADSPDVDDPASRALMRELATQAAGVTVDGASRSARAELPYGAQELVLGKHSLGLAGQVCE